MHILDFFVKNKVTICAWVYFWAFYLVPLVYISVFVPIPYLNVQVFNFGNEISRKRQKLVLQHFKKNGKDNLPFMTVIKSVSISMPEIFFFSNFFESGNPGSVFITLGMS